MRWNPTHAPTSTAWRSKLLTPSPSSRGVSQLPSISDQLREATGVRPEEFWREAVVCQSLRRQTGRRPGGAGQQVGRVHSYGALNPQAQSQVGAFAAGSSLSVWGQSAGQDKADWARPRLGVLLSVHRRAVLALVMECALLTCQAWIKRQTGHFSLCFFVLPPILSSHHLPPQPRKHTKANCHPHGLPWWAGRDELPGTRRPSLGRKNSQVQSVWGTRPPVCHADDSEAKYSE